MEPTYYFASSIVKHYGGPEKFLNFLLDSHPLGWLKSKNDSILRSEYLLVSYQEISKKEYEEYHKDIK